MRLKAIISSFIAGFLVVLVIGCITRQGADTISSRCSALSTQQVQDMPNQYQAETAHMLTTGCVTMMVMSWQAENGDIKITKDTSVNDAQWKELLSGYDDGQ